MSFESSLSDNSTIIAIIVAIIIIVLTFVIFRILVHKSSSRNALLLIGLSDAGKSVIYTRLLANRWVPTVTSMVVNCGDLRVSNKTINIIDIPGYERLQMQNWEIYKKMAKGIIFVIDSATFMTKIKDIADLMYTVMVDENVRKGKVPIFVACNKQDEAKAKSMKVIQNQIEKEINGIRESRRGALSSMEGDDDDGRTILGNIDTEFSFSDIRTPLEFGECSARGVWNGNDVAYEEDMNSIWKWVQKIA